MTGKSLLITGGAGYIGSHTLVQLLEQGYRPVVFDNFSNSSAESVRRVERLTGKSVKVIEGNITSKGALQAAFSQAADAGAPFECVLHFAGLKAVGESASLPLKYYENNVGGTVNLLETMDRFGTRAIVFSSSATVYGSPESLPYDESHRFAPTNPYGWTKAIVEQILKDWTVARKDAVAVSLRYFNPIGAHASGQIGEDPRDIPNNLFPFITQVAVGKLPKLAVFGDDYETVDGTGVRDYIHVVDLAAGHLRAVEFAESRSGCFSFNLGTGKGTSVLELVAAFEAATGKKVPYDIKGRRAGDIGSAYARVDLAREALSWRAELDVRRMCEDGWRWQSSNPRGYDAA